MSRKSGFQNMGTCVFFSLEVQIFREPESREDQLK